MVWRKRSRKGMDTGPEPRGLSNLSLFRIIAITLTFVLSVVTGAYAIDQAASNSESDAVVHPTGALSASETDPATASETPKVVLSWETGSGKSYIIPALEVPGFVILVNTYDRFVHPNEVSGGKKVYNTTPSTFWKNVTRGHWGFDQDNFKMNQLLHPYAGANYYGFARSAGLSYWESLGYSLAGSFLWETAGETTPPSVNDMVASGIGGSLFGETLFRMASLLLEGGGEKPGCWREVGAALLSPPTGFNRLVFGDRFKPVFPSHNPAVFYRLGIGATLNVHLSSRGTPTTVEHNQGMADFELSYGLPGKPGYNYKRPFDYFHFELSSLSSAKNPFQNVLLHGLLIGKKYEGPSYRGIWGLYGSYDYISPHFFRVSTTAASVGTTLQWWLSEKIAARGIALGGIGYGAGGTTAGSGERDYHYGLTPQALLALRFIFGDIAMFEATGREYYVSSLAGTEKGRENIMRGTLSIMARVYKHHALGIQYAVSRRDASYPDMPKIGQWSGTFSLVYTLLSDKSFGAVEWRAGPARDQDRR